METNRWQSRGPSPRVNVPERPGKSAPRPRMLATLATGVKGGRWHSLIDKLHPVTTLRAAFAAVSANRGAAGVDRVTIERYASDLDGNLGRLSEALRTGTCRPQAIRRHYIPKLGSQELRPLGIPTVQFEMVRYADDFVVLCRSPQDAAAALAVVQQWTAQADLTLHPVKTRLVHAWNDGFDFLGYHFERGRRWPRANSLMRLKDTIRAKTRRTVRKGLPRVIADINATLRGWYGYFQHSYRPTFRKVDGWVRRRLRSILRRRRGARGIASTEGANQTRSPNDFLAKHGLFSLQGAYDAVSQS